ncbi:MAG: hypothetical protein QUT30_06435 [Acidobacteriota bacterium]|jgi:hypothetical protein|nr:hypothetical protein [Acidobacteriota bacterium]
MKQSRRSVPEPLQQKVLHEKSEDLSQNSETVAWRSVEDALWIPYRIRGSWRGGVLG